MNKIFFTKRLFYLLLLLFNLFFISFLHSASAPPNDDCNSSSLISIGSQMRNPNLYTKFCLGLYNVATNSTPSGASVINSCGVQYNGSTQGGYAPSNNGSPSLGNIDNNSSTTCNFALFGVGLSFNKILYI